MKIYLDNKPKNNKEKHLYIESINWDDFSYKSTFEIYYFRNDKYINVGEVKIIDSENDVGRVKFDTKINRLPNNFCSLGQDESYYRNLKKINKIDRIDIIKSLNDCTYDEHIYKTFKNLDQFKSSAVRFSQAEQALKFGREIFQRKPDSNAEPCHSFQFESKLKGFDKNTN